MLDTDTRRRIDTARDILVGKVPDPKSQVEQITIALIYKFMDDMDAESEELGGLRRFFTGEFAPYGWARLMHSGLGGYEILNLYAEAISRMPENPGIPPLFRDIFKNAYLPYRDPETLRIFLRVIDEFEYDHSERLGDAFEYLLSVLGSQGDAGQFRTPRHIIDFIVAVVDPKKDEVVIDPACGTAGFLISSYKHILAACTDAEGNSTLTPDDRGRLAKNFRGYDISPDMVRLSLVNMYLHGFTDPHIFEYDTLTSQDRWNEHADVILANPPFMSPKGGIKPHNRFTVQSKRSEVLFVDYMAEHMTPTGRAGIIVPEGIIFQSGTAYKKLREMLVKEALVGVISLPSGVFQPYTGVKTSILILDKQTARDNPYIMFSSVEAIGVSLGIRRTPTERNDLPDVLNDYVAYYRNEPLSSRSWLAGRDAVLANECNLSSERYRPSTVTAKTYSVKLQDVCSLTKGSFSSTKTPAGPYPLVVTAEEPLTSASYQFDADAVCVPLISSTGHGRASIKRIHFASGKFALANLLAAVRPLDLEQLNTKYLFLVLDRQKEKMAALMKGAANVSMKVEDLAQFCIPLPPLDVQKEIVAEIEGYQKVIDGARAVVENYRPHISVRPDWPMVELGELFKLSSGRGLTSSQMKEGGYPVYGGNGRSGTHSEYFVEDPIIVIGRVGAYCGAVHITEPRAWVTDNALYITEYKQDVNQRYLAQMLVQINLNQFAKIGGQPSISQSTVYERSVPLPPLAIQQEIVAEIEAEQALVAANRELIERFERKIQTAIARVWGEEEATVLP